MRDIVVSEQVPSPPNKPTVKHSFHLDRLSVVEAPENLARKRKKLWLLSGDVCRLLLSMISLRLWTVDKKKHQLWILARFNFKDDFTLLHLFNNKRDVVIFCQFSICCDVVCAICSHLMTVGKIYKYFEDTNFHKDNKAKIVPLSKKLQST